MISKWYRAIDTQYAGGVDYFDNPDGSKGPIGIRVDEYEVRKYTPCGVRLCNGKFVNRSSVKQWASPSKEDALKSLLARRNRQLSIYQSRSQQIKQVIIILENMVNLGLVEEYCYWYKYGLEK